VNLQDFLASHRGIQAQNQWQRHALWALGLTNILTALSLCLREPPVILVPPSLPGEVQVAHNQGSGNLKESWGLYVAELIGNVTPGNAGFIERSIGPLLASDIYPEVMAILTSQVLALQADRVSVHFRTREVIYEATTDRVFVTGEQTSQGPLSAPESHPRTYELRIGFHHYRPRIEHLDVYSGDPRLEGTHPTSRSTPPSRNPA
jgi:conjugal transfer pilus assembly protein TraE